MKSQNKDLKAGVRVVIANSVVALGATAAIRSAWSIDPPTISTVLLMLWGVLLIGAAMHHTISTAFYWDISMKSGLLMITGVAVSAVVGLKLAVLPTVGFISLALGILSTITLIITLMLFYISRHRHANKAYPLYGGFHGFS